MKAPLSDCAKQQSLQTGHRAEVGALLGNNQKQRLTPGHVRFGLALEEMLPAFLTMLAAWAFISKGVKTMKRPICWEQTMNHFY
jgi:hypothetical protein